MITYKINYRFQLKNLFCFVCKGPCVCGYGGLSGEIELVLLVEIYNRYYMYDHVMVTLIYY